MFETMETMEMREVECELNETTQNLPSKFLVFLAHVFQLFIFKAFEILTLFCYFNKFLIKKKSEEKYFHL